MTRTIALFVVAIAAVSLVIQIAQADQVVLKDGRVITGRIVGESGEGVILQISKCPATLTAKYPKAEIDHVAKEPANSTSKVEKRAVQSGPPALTEREPDADLLMAPRLPVPDAAAEAQSLKLIREVFAGDYASHRTSDHIVLANKLLKQAMDGQADHGGR